MAGGRVQECHHPGPSLALHQGQRGGRFSVQEQSQSMGLCSGQGVVRHDSGVFSTSSNFGCLCIQGSSSASKVHVLVSGSGCCGQRCTSSSVGQSNLPVPPSSIASESTSADSGTKDPCNSSVSSVAHSNVVASVSGDVGGTTPSSSILPPGSSHGGGGTGSALSRSANSCTSFGQEFSLSHPTSGLDQDDLDFLSNHLAHSTRTGYGYVFKRFRGYCENIHEDPYTCAPAIIVKYIRNMYESGAEYSTVNHHRSCTSKFHYGFGNITAGSHPLVTQAVKAVFRLKPPLPKYISTFDISVVFSYIQSLPQNEQLSLKLLSFKTLFLLTASTISRLSSLNRLGPELLVFEVRLFNVFNQFTLFCLQDHCVLNFITLEKQGRPNRVRGYLRVQRFLQDTSLCPVAALVTYQAQVC